MKHTCSSLVVAIWRHFASFFRDVGPNKFQVALVLFQMFLVGATISVTKFPESLMAGPDPETNEFIVGNFIGSTSFLITYGFTKAISNVIVGLMADSYGRKFPNWLGWLFGAIVPIMVIFAHNWTTVVASNLFLGIQQGLTWSTLLFIIIDYAGPKNRGVAISLNEGTGYVSIAVFNVIAATLVDEDNKNYRPKPYYLVFAMMVVAFVSSIVLLKDTSHLVKKKSEPQMEADDLQPEKKPLISKESTISAFKIFWYTSFKNKSLSVICWAGLVVNAVVALAWGVFIKWMKTGNTNGNWMAFSASDVAQAGLTFDLTHGLVQCFSGLVGDMTGRKRLNVGGFFLMAVSLALLAYVGEMVQTSQRLIRFTFYFLGASTGVGIGLVYPNLIAACCDHVEPHWRASALGTYRFWRDMGYAIGALLAGVLTEVGGFPVTVGSFAVVCAITSLLIALVYEEKSVPELEEKLAPEGVRKKTSIVEIPNSRP